MYIKHEVISEQASFLVINKPSGLLTIPDRHNPEKDNLYSRLKKRYGDIYIVHRLDRETSGIICFARTAEAHKNLCRQFESRTVEKYYLVLLSGILSSEEGIIDKPIGPSKAISGKMVISRSGKPSLTTFRVKERFKGFTLVEAELKTGRMHQIRVHFQSTAHPLAIDAIYGNKPAFFLSDIKKKAYRKGKFKEELPLMNRSSLHAFRLCFDHPETGERQEFEASLHKDFRAVLQQLRKWAGI